jgi:hypothetical protein
LFLSPKAAFGKRPLVVGLVVLLSGKAAASFGGWPDVFDPLQLRILHLEMAPGDWATIQNDETLSVAVPAYFHEEGDAPILVSVRRKSADPLDEAPGFTKVSLKIDINDFIQGQSWHGLKKLSVENGDDNDVVAEGMAWQLERLASGTQGYGYPVGHFAWVRLFINGVDTGVYVNVEQPDKRFLENRGLFAQGQTWLYKVSDVNGSPDLEVGGPQDSPTLDALCYAPFADDPSCPAPDLAAHLPQHVSMAGLLTEMAADAFQGNPDALLTKGKNFYFADFLGGALRMYFPWDRDSSLSGNAVNASIFPAGSDYAALLNVPPFRAQYNRILEDLVCGPWSEASLLAFVDAVEPVLTNALAADANNQFGDPAERFDSLRAWLSARVAAVTAQIEDFEPCPTVQVRLNELMADNAASLEDPDEPGEFPDWIELHNPTGETIDLGGLYLTDDPAQPTKYQVPAGVTIPPFGHRVFYADEDPEQGPLHADFKLAAVGEVVAIHDTDGVQEIDAIAFGAQLSDVSFGRYPNGSGSWGFMSDPTPEGVNAPHNVPPTIDDVVRIPTLPGAADAVLIRAHVIDPDGAVAGVVLQHDVGGSWLTTPMLDDGLSGDGAAGDDVYGATLPAQPSDTLVHYYLTASDTLGASRASPAAAPALTHGYLVSYVPPVLVINEFMANNDSVIEDPDEPLAFEDWIEIHNPGPASVDLGGMYLTDDLDQPQKFSIPAGLSIPGGGYLLFWADGEPLQGATHTSFKLNAGGEQLGLHDTDAHGNLPLDTRSFGSQSINVSEGRCPDGGTTWQLFAVPTPGVPNPACSGGPEACCLLGGACRDVGGEQCLELGGASQGAGSTCATASCPECFVDDDCDDGVLCTIETCHPTARVCQQTPFDSVCQDGLFCNGSEWCDSLAGCSAGAPPCDAASCDEPADICAGSVAGSVPDGAWTPGLPLTLAKSPGAITLAWGASCLVSDTDYAIYEGWIGDWTSHAPRTCTTDGMLQATLAPGSGARYYLVVPRNAASEGSRGRTSAGLERPPGAFSCLSQLTTSCAD